MAHSQRRRLDTIEMAVLAKVAVANIRDPRFAVPILKLQRSLRPCSTVQRISDLHVLGLLRTPQSGDGEALVSCCRITSEGMDELRTDLPALLKEARKLAKSELPKDHPESHVKVIETFELWQAESGILQEAPPDPSLEENTILEETTEKDNGLTDDMANGGEFGDDLLDIEEEEEESQLAAPVATKPKKKTTKKTTRKPTRGPKGRFS